jgi:hypothetical protein
MTRRARKTALLHSLPSRQWSRSSGATSRAVRPMAPPRLPRLAVPAARTHTSMTGSRLLAWLCFHLFAVIDHHLRCFKPWIHMPDGFQPRLPLQWRPGADCRAPSACRRVSKSGWRCLWLDGTAYHTRDNWHPRAPVAALRSDDNRRGAGNPRFASPMPRLSRRDLEGGFATSGHIKVNAAPSLDCAGHGSSFVVDRQLEQARIAVRRFITHLIGPISKVCRTLYLMIASTLAASAPPLRKCNFRSADHHNPV